MIDLDIRTLLVVTALISIGSAVALIALWRAQSRPNGAGFWASGMSCVALASLLISERGSIPEFISIVVANCLYVIGFVLILRGIRVFAARPPLPFFDFVLPTISAVLFYYFNYVEQNINMRIIVISTAFALTCSVIVFTLLRDKQAPWRHAGFAVAMVYGLFGIFHGARGVVALISPFEHSFMHTSISSSLVFLAGIFILGGSAITLVLLVHATLESEFRIVSRAVEQSASSIIITDTSGSIDYVNPAFSEKTGYTAEEVIGKTPRILGSGETNPDEYERLWQTLKEGNTWRGEFHNRRKNGELFWEIASIAPVKQRNGNISHYVAVKEDISALKEAEESILYLANHDALTGLPTRRLSMDRLMSALAVSKRNKTKVAVMFVDLDGFKIVNDTLGHDAGDKLLKETAVRLCSCVREVDTVARVGGDEFWVLLTDVTSTAAITKVAEKITQAVAKPYQLNSEVVNIGASVGIAVSPDHALDPEKLIQLADQAMYKIKRQGKNNYAFTNTIIEENAC